MRQLRHAAMLLLGLMAMAPAMGQVQWHTIGQAAEARIGTKLYFVDLYTDWCGYCKKMDRDTFSDPTVAAILNKYYYPVKFNAEKEKTFQWFGTTYRASDGRRGSIHDFARGVRGFPTFMLLRSDGSSLQAVPGFYNAKDFAVVLWYFASGDCDRYPFDRYQQIFDKDIRPTMLKQLK